VEKMVRRKEKNRAFTYPSEGYRAPNREAMRAEKVVIPSRATSPLSNPMYYLELQV